MQEELELLRTEAEDLRDQLSARAKELDCQKLTHDKESSILRQKADFLKSQFEEVQKQKE